MGEAVKRCTRLGRHERQNVNDAKLPRGMVTNLERKDKPDPYTRAKSEFTVTMSAGVPTFGQLTIYPPSFSAVIQSGLGVST
jgi:hypothetical protein